MKRREVPPSERDVPSKWSFELPIPAEPSQDRVSHLIGRRAEGLESGLSSQSFELLR